MFDPLSAAALLILAASPAKICEVPKPAEIRVIPSSQEVAYDYSQTLADLQGTATDTIDPHSFNGISVTQGYMKGGIRLKPKVTYGNKYLPSYRAYCVWYDTITIELEIDPMIVIAKEVRDDLCMRKAVKEHELKHVMVDRKIVNKYAKSMGQAIYGELGQRGFAGGPVEAGMAQKLVDRMSKTVFQIVEHEYKKMDIERLEAQRAVDNLEEYQGVAAKCPDFRPHVGK